MVDLLARLSLSISSNSLCIDLRAVIENEKDDERSGVIVVVLRSVVGI